MKINQKFLSDNFPFFCCCKIFNILNRRVLEMNNKKHVYTCVFSLTWGICTTDLLAKW